MEESKIGSRGTNYETVKQSRREIRVVWTDVVAMGREEWTELTDMYRLESTGLNWLDTLGERGIKLSQLKG